MIYGELQRSFLPGWLLGGKDLFLFDSNFFDQNRDQKRERRSLTVV